MPKVKLYVATSLDGFIAERDGGVAARTATLASNSMADVATRVSSARLPISLLLLGRTASRRFLL
jgi:hypothetical protein